MAGLEAERGMVQDLLGPVGRGEQKFGHETADSGLETAYSTSQEREQGASIEGAVPMLAPL